MAKRLVWLEGNERKEMGAERGQGATPTGACTHTTAGTLALRLNEMRCFCSVLSRGGTRSPLGGQFLPVKRADVGPGQEQRSLHPALVQVGNDEAWPGWGRREGVRFWIYFEGRVSRIH